MGITLQAWRARIGTFIHRGKRSNGTKNTDLSFSFKFSLSIRILLFVLLVANGIESNPGPNNKENKKSTNKNIDRQEAAKGSRIPPHREPKTPTNVDSSQSPVQQDEIPSRKTRKQRKQNKDQSRINQFFSQSNRNLDETVRETDQENELTYETANDTSDDEYEDGGLTMSDFKDILLDIRREVKHTNREFDKLNDKVNDLKEDNKRLNKENEELNQKVSTLNETVNSLRTLTHENQYKMEQMEAQSRRDNLKFHNIPESPNKTWEKSEHKIRTYITNDLNMDSSRISIERAHRLAGKSRQIIVKFSFFKDKEAILFKYRERAKARRSQGNQPEENPVRVTEDFPARVTKARTDLYPFLMKCFEDKKKAFLRYDTLVIDGVPHIYDAETKSIVRQKKPTETIK